MFSRAVRIEPRASVPAGAEYDARGVFSSAPVDVQTLEGVVSTQRTTLGIKLDEQNANGTAMFAVAPEQGDRVRVDGVWYRVSDTDDDGQGGRTLMLVGWVDE
jgi:hypothetical protein